MQKHKKIKLIGLISSIIAINQACATSGLYLGGGIGAGLQSLSTNTSSSPTYTTPAVRTFAGYQFASWLGAEFGYTYLTQTQNWQNLGPSSTTVYDFSFTPGFSIPMTPVTIFTRLGIDGVSSNLNNTFYNQFFSNLQANFVWGGGIKLDIPGTRAFVRAEYMNFGSGANNSNSTITNTSSALMINAAYVF